MLRYKQSPHHLGHVQALVIIALVYASQEEPGGPAGRLLAKHDVSTRVIAWLEGTVRGDGLVNGQHTSVDEAAHSAQALSLSPVLADQM